MKKYLCLVLSLMLALSLTACAQEGGQTAGGEVDAYTTATETKYIDGKNMMPKELVEEKIAKMLIGPGDYREMYTLGTSYNNVPLTSAIEFVYQPETMRFYGMADLGTEKLERSSSTIPYPWAGFACSPLTSWRRARIISPSPRASRSAERLSSSQAKIPDSLMIMEFLSAHADPKPRPIPSISKSSRASPT